MKKFNILMLGAFALLAASCEKDLDPAIPQENPQEPIMTVGDVVSEAAGPLAQAATAGYVLNLEDYNTDNALIPVMKTDEIKNLPAGATVEYKVEFAASDDFKDAVTLDAIGHLSEDTENEYFVDAHEWNDMHLKLFGKSPKEKTVYYRVPVYIEIEGSDYRYESTSFYAVSGKLVETCMDSGFVIEDHYYLLGDCTTWDLGDAAAVEAHPFKHNDEKSVYDDPVFTIKFTVGDNGTYWKIAPQSIVGTDNWGGCVGTATDGDTAMEGHLLTENAQSGHILEPGKYKMTINMEAMTYVIELLLQPEYVYTPGGSNGWNQLASAWLQQDADKNYYGATPVDGGLKLCTEEDWNNDTDYGAETDAPALAGNLVLGVAAKNMNVPENGLYWMNVTFDASLDELKTYKFTKLTSVGLIGSFEPSNWGQDVEMTHVEATDADGNPKETGEYSCTVALKAGNEIKVRFNNDWTYNYGVDENADPSTSLDKLVAGGANYKVEEDGTYVVTLHLLGGVARLTLDKQ